MDDGADGQQALVADGPGGGFELSGLGGDSVQAVDDLIVDQSLLAAADDHVHPHPLALPRPHRRLLFDLGEQFLFGLEDFLLEFVLQVADADGEPVRAGLDFGLGEGRGMGRGEVGGEGVEQSHLSIDSY